MTADLLKFVKVSKSCEQVLLAGGAVCLPFCSTVWSCVSAGGGKQGAAGINTAANDRLILFSSDLYLSIFFFNNSSSSNMVSEWND